MLYLFPNVLDETQEYKEYISSDIEAYVARIDGVIAESEKGARSFLKRFTFDRGRSFREIPIKLLNEHTQLPELQELITPLCEGQVWGIVSDCGLPCLADPGAQLVALARKKGVSVKAFSGPSSIIMALMLSGLVVQQFSFHGYLPREPQPLDNKLKAMTVEVIQEQRTQVFIEAPYRNQKLLQSVIQHLPKDFVLTVVCDVTLPTEEVASYPVHLWRSKDLSRYHKRPAVIVFGLSPL